MKFTKCIWVSLGRLDMEINDLRDLVMVWPTYVVFLYSQFPLLSARSMMTPQHVRERERDGQVNIFVMFSGDRLKSVGWG